MEIKVLHEDQIQKIKQMTEELIEKTGFRVENRELLDIAKKHGAIVNMEEQTIKIPGDMLRDLLSKVPESYEAKGIDGKSFTVGKGAQYISAIVTDPWIIDYETGKKRRPGLEDVRINTILSQLNEKVASIGRMDYPVTEYDDITSSLKALEIHILNHVKHYNVYTACIKDLLQWMEIGDILTQCDDLSGSSLMTVAVAVVSPFVLPRFNGQAMIEAAKRNFTVVPTICPMAGTTSAYSLDATLLQGNTENIFIAALTQMLNPGNPFLYAFGPSVSDMRTGHDLYYTIDKCLWKTAAVELAKSYKIPVCAECGGTMSHRYDMQSGAESMLFMLGAQNSKADLLAGVGSCCNANGLSSEMMMIQYEWLKAAEHLSKGIDTENLAEGMKSIIDQGPGGNFLMDDLTIKNLRRNEFFQSDIMDMTGGAGPESTMLEKAHKKVRELTEDYISPVPGNIQESLKRYFHDLYRSMR
jgi:trimethylamine---corrinoid protein Co-methyltransferase